MKVIVFGGSFNPIHLGHINLVLWAKQKLMADKIFLVPSGRAFFKDDYNISNKDRLAMLELATKNYEFIEILPYSLPVKDGGLDLVYSIDLIVYLLDKKIILEKPYFLLGDDLTLDFSKWKDVDSLISKVDLVLAKRQKNAIFNYPHIELENSIYAISSSKIRTDVKNNNSLTASLNADVIDYIKKEGLYL